LARAKQTNRAEARRRYRQTTAQSIDVADLESDDDASAPPVRSSRPATKPAAATGRPGLVAAFRGAYRPARYREDLAALPELVRGRWFLVSVGLIVVGFGASLIPNALTPLVFQTLLYPPAMLPIFLVGFTAPRASYLLGLIVGIVDVLLYSLWVAVASQGTVSNIPTSDLLLTGLTVGVPAGVLFAAGAAWYRRFLALSSAGRGQTRSSNRGRAGAKAANRR
jgi:hypothetical protein